jgi:molybdopterin molybdotransferase
VRGTAARWPGGQAALSGVGSALTPVDQALSRLLAGLQAVEPRTARLRGVEGKILAEPFRATDPVPRLSIALRDGWAVAAEAVVGASSYSPVFPPEPPLRVLAGEALPPGVDCVLPPDAVSEMGGIVEITASAPPGDGVRRAGEDALIGAVLREAGEVVRAIDVAAASAAGLDRCIVREPRLRLLSIHAKPDAVTDFLQRHGVIAGAQVVHQAVGERTRASAVVSTPPADLILMAGDRALAVEILAQNGVVTAHALALRPGEGAVCGRIGDTPAIIIPPPLEAALAIALLLVGPCLDRLSGAKPRTAARQGRLTRKIASALGITELVLLRETSAGFEPLAVADLPLAVLGAADHWLAVPPESEGFPAGELVEAHRL